MLIWKGHGILILVFGVLGGMIVAFLSAFMYTATQWVWMGRLTMCAPFWGAALAIWLYAKTLGKPTERTFLDPATHRPVVITSSHSFFFIPPVPWAVLATILACVFSVFAVVAPAPNFDFSAMGAGSGSIETEFEKANDLISRDKGQEAYGNTPEAQQMAAKFAKMVKLGRQMGVQAGKKPTISFSHGKFLTYCRINPDSCVFMVHVPDLRKFSKDAKEYIADIAWLVAMQSASTLQPQPKRVAVGIRGAFLYDAVIEGHIVADDNDAEEGIEQRHTNGSPQKFLEPYFVASKTAPAALPKPGPVDESEQKSASPDSPTKIPSATPGAKITKSATTPHDKVEVLLKWFPTTKAGEVGSNADAANQLALHYAGLVHSRVAANPALGGMTLPDPFFSAYIHVRDDSVAFLLAIPSGSDLSEGAVKLIQREAWGIAAVASAQMSPMPARIAVITFNEGQMDLTRIGKPKNPEGSEWIVEQELPGEQGRDQLAPFVQPSSKPLIAVKTPIIPQSAVKSELRIMGPAATPADAVLPANTALPAPVALGPVVAAAPAPAPAPAPVLPTPLRDWKDSTGRIMQASLERFTSPARDTGYFKRADGQGFEVPFSRLSAEDQAFIRGIASKLP
jgi:hypothetical protein